MIIVTGATGFIGSCMIGKLNKEGFNRIVAVDSFAALEKNRNLIGKSIEQKIDRDNLATWLDTNGDLVEFIFHLGARTDTTETNRELLWRLNTDYSKVLWSKCVEMQIPLVYASSAATYGNGEKGYSDNESNIHELKPLNLYGLSKQEFDLWALNQTKKPFFWAGLKFFNVYGPNEYHKSRMASVIYHAFNQILKNKSLKLFRSHHADFADGEQLRDFIYVKDVVDVMYWLMHHRKNSGIYNLGTGTARTFKDLGSSVFASLGIEEKIEFIDTPLDIRDKYQYYTQANMQKLEAIGYSQKFTPLEKGVEEYVKDYLDHTLVAHRHF